MAYVNKINVQGTNYGIQDERIPGDGALDFSNIDLEVKTVKQSQANYSKDFTSVAYHSYLTPTTIFNRFEELNNDVKIIISMYSTENQGVSHTEQEAVLSYNAVDLESDIADKIYDINGQKVSQAVSASAIITIIPAKALVVGQEIIDCDMILYNATIANRMLCNVIAHNKTIAANEVIQVFARTYLSLL